MLAILYSAMSSNPVEALRYSEGVQGFRFKALGLRAGGFRIEGLRYPKP